MAQLKRISIVSLIALGMAMPAVAQSFGPAFIAQDGSLDRQRMREHVFTNPDARRLLESIVHPLVAQEIQRQAKAAASHCLVFDVPLLVESPRWRPQLDLVLVVDCETATQIRRVASRSGLDRSAIGMPGDGRGLRDEIDLEPAPEAAAQQHDLDRHVLARHPGHARGAVDRDARHLGRGPQQHLAVP